MSTGPKPETAPSAHDEERLAQALVSRGLLTREEAKQCRVRGDKDSGPEALLKRLVAARFLTPNQAQRVQKELELFVGQQIPGYQMLEKLGQGGMGIVFKARQLSMNRLVAIKILQPKLAANPRDLDRFLHEAHLAARLSHNNIVQGIDAGTAGKIHYFVMEYLEGTPISKLLDKGKVFEETEALEIILQMAQALEHAHRRGLIHRDIKPGNIILTNEGVAKLADLGLAMQTKGEDQLAQEDKEIVRGTPYYIAPEQIQNREDIDIRADIYSLGATLYQMVTGKPPFEAKSVRTLFEAHLRKKLVPPDHINTKLSSGLGEVVELMMAKDRNQRYQTPRELVRDLESLMAGEAPKFARQRIQQSMLKDLADGDTGESAEAAIPPTARATGVPPIWLAVVSVLLAISVFFNFLLWFRG